MCVEFRARRISPGVFCYEVIHLKELLENAKENLSFLLICILIALALVAVARIAEHFLPHKRKVSPTRRITLIAICGAMATTRSSARALRVRSLIFGPSF